MSKKTRRIVLMISTLVVLLVIDLGINKMNEKKEQQEAQEEEESKITAASIATEDIASFSYDYNGETYSYTKKDDTWYCDQDESINLIQDDIETMLSSVAELQAERLIEESDENLAEYGLDSPSQTIEIKDANDDSTVIQIGSLNSTTNCYYLTIEGSEKVYTVDSTIATTFQKTVEDLTETEDTTSEDTTNEDTAVEDANTVTEE